MNTLIIMVGIPGSGKTTYAKKLLELHPDWKYVSRDEVRYEYVTDQAHYFDHESEVYKEFCNRLSMHLINGDTVIADATHMTSKSRFKLIKNLSIKPDKIICVVMTTNFECCMARNAQRQGIIRVPDDSMYRMKNTYKKPNSRVEEYIDQIVWVKS
jgi:predicted kinase